MYDTDGIVLTCPECSHRGTFKTTSIDSWQNYIGYQCQQCFFMAPEDDEWLINAICASQQRFAIATQATPEEQAYFNERQQRKREVRSND